MKIKKHLPALKLMATTSLFWVFLILIAVLLYQTQQYSLLAEENRILKNNLDEYSKQIESGRIILDIKN